MYLAEIFRRAIESRLTDLNTMTVGRVKTYDAAKQTADIIPMIRRPVPTADGETTHEDLPILPNVPICFPRNAAATSYWVWPLVPGDWVTIGFLTHSIQQWRRSGGPSDPGDLRLHHLGNALAWPELAPNATPLPSVDRMVIHCAQGIDLIEGAADPVANGAAVQAWITSLTTGITGLGGSVVAPTNPLYTSPASMSFTKVRAK